MLCPKRFQSSLTCGQTGSLLHSRPTLFVRDGRMASGRSFALSSQFAGNGLLPGFEIPDDLPTQVRNGSLELLETVLKPFDFFPGNYFLEFLTVVNFLILCYIFVVLMPRK
ncbi:hypothetical protein PSENEW3_00002605 [Picochlorum sp. SENEW3]|nr:hypothetical protein PSENEW3_00002605 [Picochlorum sp. SENEW3]